MHGQLLGLFVFWRGLPHPLTPAGIYGCVAPNCLIAASRTRFDGSDPFFNKNVLNFCMVLLLSLSISPLSPSAGPQHHP
jgi:hypothetical protein